MGDILDVNHFQKGLNGRANEVYQQISIIDLFNSAACCSKLKYWFESLSLSQRQQK